MQDTHVDKTVLFADIAGSTRMYGEYGDDATQALLVNCLDLMDKQVREHQGTVVRRIGDELLCTFAGPNEAAMAAISMHSEVCGGDTRGLFPRPMRIRVGFEHGSIIETPQALFGNTVHTAARLAALAKAGQTVTTLATLERLNPALRPFSRFLDTTVLKGQSGEQQIYELLWSVPSATVTTKRADRTQSSPRVQAVEIECGGHRYRVDASRPRLEIGRDLSCDLCVPGSSVSHLHARILWASGRVRVEDVSTNGTVIERDAGVRLPLHRESATLQGSGALHLGAEDGGAVISYRCETAGGPAAP